MNAELKDNCFHDLPVLFIERAVQEHAGRVVKARGVHAYGRAEPLWMPRTLSTALLASARVKRPTLGAGRTFRLRGAHLAPLLPPAALCRWLAERPDVCIASPARNPYGTGNLVNSGASVAPFAPVCKENFPQIPENWHGFSSLRARLNTSSQRV